MKKITLLCCVFTLLIINNFSFSQTIFDWESNFTTSPSVTQTVDGITATVTTSNNTIIQLIDAAGFDGSSGNVIYTPSGTDLTVSFNSTVDIANIFCFTGLSSTGSNWTLTPNGGTNTPVNVSLSATLGSNVAVNWTGVTSFTITEVGATNYNFGIDNITLGTTCSEPGIPTVSISSAPSCPGDSATLSISGSLNDATSWVVYSGSCGGTLVGSTMGNSITINNINSDTDYYVRGEGGCTTPGSCASTTVTVSDTTNPTIGAIADQELAVNSNNCTASLPDYTSLAVVADNCDASPSVTQSPSPGATIGTTTTVTLTVTDASGNSNNTSFDVSIIDETNPTIATIADQLVAVNSNNCAASLPDYTSLAVVADNCDAFPSVTQSPSPGTTITTTTTVTLTVADASGNSNNTSFDVSIIDETNPTIATIANQEVAVNTSCEASLPDYTSLAVVADNCDAFPSVTQSPNPGTTITTTTTVTLTVADASGNSNNTSFDVSLVDETSPTIATIANQQLAVNTSCEASLPDYTGLAVVGDNCDASPSVTQSPNPGTTISTTTTVTLTVSDASGNSNNTSFDVSLIDYTPPTISTIADQTINNNETGTTLMPDYTGLAVVSDNCDATPNITQSPTSGTAITGNTIVTLTVQDGSGNSNSTSFNVIFTNITWTGTDSEAWETANNWSTGTVPTATSNVIIPTTPSGNYFPTITDPVSVNSITVQSGASLIHNNTVSTTNNVVYNRLLPTTNWYLIASPVAGETVPQFYNNNIPLATGSGTGPNQNIGLAPYNNNAGWAYYTTGDVDQINGDDTTDQLMTGTGYSIKLSTAGNVAFSGSLSNNESSTSVTTGTVNDYNLIGNPYPCYINSDDLINNNSTIKDETLWVFNGTDYNTHNIPNPIDIAPTQGFFVEADNTSGTSLTFNHSSRRHFTADTFSKQASSVAKFELFLEKATKKTSTLVFYIDGKTTGFDSGYDSKMFGATNYDFAVFTQLVTDNQGENLAIQTVPTNNSLAIPVGVIANKDEEVTFSVEQLNLPEGTSVYLEDKANNEYINLTEGNYTITLQEDYNGIGNFYIYTSAKSLSIDESDLTTVSIYKSSNSEITVTGLNDEANISIYSLLGKNIAHKTLYAKGVNKVNLPTVNAGVYIVKLNTQQGEITQKIIIE